ncbi:MAG TPA: hypothetical protein VK568_13295 [Thermodesulfobacteriota bacterium]|nr:hypothetical protein [Thermodesulfobacteriota bacterium]
MDCGPLGETSEASRTLGARPLGIKWRRLGLDRWSLGVVIAKNEELKV